MGSAVQALTSSSVVSPVIAPSTIRGAELLERVDYRLAETDEEKEAIYRLRYRAYLNEGAISPLPEKRLQDRFDDMPNSWTFGIFVDGHLTSSIRISVGSRDNPVTPATDAFSDILGREIDQGRVIVDPNRFVADPQRALKLPALPYIAVRLGYVACSYFNADIGTATVRIEHQAFYRRVFMLRSLCEPRPYPTLTKPLGLMAAPFAEVRDQIYQRYPFFRSSYFERRMLFGRPAAPAAVPIPLPIKPRFAPPAQVAEQVATG